MGQACLCHIDKKGSASQITGKHDKDDQGTKRSTHHIAVLGQEFTGKTVQILSGLVEEESKTNYFLVGRQL